MSKPSAKLKAAFARLDALYAELPTIACQGRCAIACGSIPLTDLEARRLKMATHIEPKTVDGLPALRDFVPRRQLLERCVYLTPAERCSVYAIRPLICRAWGLVRMMSCIHGCMPSRWMNDLEFVRLAQRVERIAGGRLIHTTRDGLAHTPGENFSSLGTPRRSAEAIERDSERTRNLRALHGGRIICAVDKGDT